VSAASSDFERTNPRTPESAPFRSKGTSADPIKARSQSGFRSGTQSDPCISSIHTAIMITTSNSPVRRSGMPYQLLGVLLHTMAMSGLARVRTELL
jgi:hypothetical protein